ncbi:MAG: hypothetical protein ACK4PG_09810 [Acetobacteraceae bacterium]
MSDRPNDPPVRHGDDPEPPRPRWSDLAATSAPQGTEDAPRQRPDGAPEPDPAQDGAARAEPPHPAAPPEAPRAGTPQPAPPANPAALAQDRRDTARIVLTLLTALLQPAMAVLPTAFGLGRPIGELSAASQTAVTPAGYAFAIWTPIFALAIAYAAWQALPARRDSPLCRRIGWPLIGAFALSNLWMLLAQTTSNGWHLVLVLAGVAGFSLAAFLGARRMAHDYGLVSRFLVAPLLGLLAGWTVAAVFVNLAGAARATEAPWWMAEPTAAAMMTVIAAGVAGTLLLKLAARDLWFAGALLWALIAILAANLGAVAVNLPVAIAAAGMLVLVAVAARPDRR